MSFRIMREQREQDRQRMLALEEAKSRCGGSLKAFYRHLVNGERACDLCQAVARKASAEEHRGWKEFDRLHALRLDRYDSTHHLLRHEHAEIAFDGGDQLLARWDQAARTWDWEAAAVLIEDSNRFLEDTKAERASIRRKRQAAERKAARLAAPPKPVAFSDARLQTMHKPGVYLVGINDGSLRFGCVGDVADRIQAWDKQVKKEGKWVLYAEFVSPSRLHDQQVIVDNLIDYCTQHGSRAGISGFTGVDFAGAFDYLTRISTDARTLADQDKAAAKICGVDQGTVKGYERHRSSAGFACTSCRQASYRARDQRRSDAADLLGVPVIGIYALLWSNGCIKVGFSTRMAGRIEEHVIAQGEATEPKTLQRHFAVPAIDRAQAVAMERELLRWCRAQPGMRQEKSEYFYGLELTVVQEQMTQIARRFARLAA